MTNKFKVGDSVRRKSPRAKAAKIVGEYGKGWYDISYPSTDKRYRIHQRFLELIVKPESKDRSELYKLLPRVSEWPEWANWASVNGDAIEVLFCQLKPSIKTKMEYWTETSREGSVSFGNTITLPPSINWKDTLVSREEMERWEKSQEPTEDELNMPIEDYYMKKLNESDPESYEIDWSLLDEKATHHVFDRDGKAFQCIGAKDTDLFKTVGYGWSHMQCATWKDSPLTLPPGADWKKSLRVNPNIVKSEPIFNVNAESPESFFDQSQAEVRRLEVLKSLESKSETPQAKVERLKAELKEAEQELDRVTPVEFPDVVLSLYVMVGKEWAPEGLKHKCLMFNSNRLRMEQSPHGDFTVLTFFEK